MTKIILTNVAPLLSDTVFNGAFKKVSVQRQEKIKILKHRDDKNLSLGAGLILEYVLKDFLKNYTYTDIGFTKKGKPFLKNHPGVHFSLSHSGDMAICAVSDCPVGIDIQLCTDFKEEICRRYFKKSEADFVFGAKTPEEKKERFFKIWTLKEAYTKMTGGGIGEFRDFELDVKSEITVKRDGQLMPLSFFEFDISGYKTSLCICGEEKEPELKTVNIFNLLIN